MTVSRSGVHKITRAIARGWTTLHWHGPCRFLKGHTFMRRQRDRLVTPGWRPIFDGQEVE